MAGRAVTTPLPIPDDPRVQALIDDWPKYAADPVLRFPRSHWLGLLERVLREHYPRASSKQLTLTARNLAPFPLRLPGVP
jgi:hypothetical protein